MLKISKVTMGAVLASLALAGTALAQRPAPFEDARIASIQVHGGESRVLDFRYMKRVSITEPKIADVAVLSATELRIDGHAAGFTTLIVWDENGRRQFDIEVAPRRLPASAATAQLRVGAERIGCLASRDLVGSYPLAMLCVRAHTGD